MTGDTRTVPVTPELAKILKAHLEEFGASPGGRLFTGVNGGELASVVCRRAWAAAREAALTGEQLASSLAKCIDGQDATAKRRIAESLSYDARRRLTPNLPKRPGRRRRRVVTVYQCRDLGLARLTLTPESQAAGRVPAGHS